MTADVFSAAATATAARSTYEVCIKQKFPDLIARKFAKIYKIYIYKK